MSVEKVKVVEVTRVVTASTAGAEGGAKVKKTFMRDGEMKHPKKYKFMKLVIIEGKSSTLKLRCFCPLPLHSPFSGLHLYLTIACQL